MPKSMAKLIKLAGAAVIIVALIWTVWGIVVLVLAAAGWKQFFPSSRGG